jgi:magnesium chelatase family protein
VSGPILDRIDLVLEVPAVPVEDLFRVEAGEPSAAARERVVRARGIASLRNPEGGRNAALSARELKLVAPLDPPARRVLRGAAETLRITARGVLRTHRLARSIADLAGSEEVRREHVSEALQYRMEGSGRTDPTR